MGADARVVEEGGSEVPYRDAPMLACSSRFIPLAYHTACGSVGAVLPPFAPTVSGDFDVNGISVTRRLGKDSTA